MPAQASPQTSDTKSPACASLPILTRRAVEAPAYAGICHASPVTFVMGPRLTYSIMLPRMRQTLLGRCACTHYLYTRLLVGLHAARKKRCQDVPPRHTAGNICWWMPYCAVIKCSHQSAVYFVRPVAGLPAGTSGDPVCAGCTSSGRAQRMEQRYVKGNKIAAGGARRHQSEYPAESGWANGPLQSCQQLAAPKNPKTLQPFLFRYAARSPAKSRYKA